MNRPPEPTVPRREPPGETRRFPRTLRLDDSDSHVFDRAAEPGEWAIPGSFVFSRVASEALEGTMRGAFVQGFLGLSSFGWATLVEVAEIAETDYAMLTDSLAMHFVARYGAPDIAAAAPEARREMEFAASLCEHEARTILAVERRLEADGIHERFRVVARPGDPRLHQTGWSSAGEDDA
jgi:hypothetical protein